MSKWLHESDFDDVIARVSQEQGIAPEVIKALIATESAFNAQATKQESGGRYSIGLTQPLWPGTVQALGYLGQAGSPDDLSGVYDPYTNVTLGVRYLLQQYAKAGRWDGAYSAYNGGWNPSRAMGTPAVQPVTVTVDSLTGRQRTAAVGEYGNQPAVDRFMANLAYFQGQSGSGGSVIPEVGAGLALAAGVGLALWLLIGKH